MSSLPKNPNPMPTQVITCGGCHQEIDPGVCWCGDDIRPGVVHDNHYPIPMGCVCGYGSPGASHE